MLRKQQTSAELDKRTLAQSKDGRKELIVIAKPGFYKVKWTRGGQLPTGLEGKFTTRQIAEEQIALWVARR